MLGLLFGPVNKIPWSGAVVNYIFIWKEILHLARVFEFVPSVKHMLHDGNSCQHSWVSLHTLAWLNWLHHQVLLHVDRHSQMHYSEICWMCPDVCSDCSMKAAHITVQDIGQPRHRILHSHIKRYVLPMIKSVSAWRWLPKLLLKDCHHQIHCLTCVSCVMHPNAPHWNSCSCTMVVTQHTTNNEKMWLGNGIVWLCYIFVATRRLPCHIKSCQNMKCRQNEINKSGLQWLLGHCVVSSI
jgi:hypothetical protein